MKRNFLFLFYLLAGILVGAVIAQACSGVPSLKWLGYSQEIGFSPANPAVLDLNIVRITFGFAMRISLAQVITISLALYLYVKSRVK